MPIIELAAVAIIFFVLYKVHQDYEAKREEERHRKEDEERRKKMIKEFMDEQEAKAIEDSSWYGPF